jgi:GGDEF domain-containing protein
MKTQLDQMLLKSDFNEAMEKLFSQIVLIGKSMVADKEPGDRDNYQAKYEVLMADIMKLESAVSDIRRALEIKEIELKAVLAQAHEISNTDSVTYLPNRRKVMVDLMEEVIRVSRYGLEKTMAEQSGRMCCAA